MFKRIRSFLFENKTAKQTVAKNTFWLSVTNFGGRAVKSIIVLYAARVLNTAGYGVFSYAVTLAGFFTLFLDPGVNAMVMREVPKGDEAEKRSFLSTTFVIKLILLGVGIPFVLLVAPLFSTLPGAPELLPLVALLVSFDTIRELFSAFMRARERMEWETASFITTNVVIVLAGLYYLSISATPAAFAWAYITGTVCGTLVSIVFLRDYLGDLFSRFSKKLVGPIVRSAWPFAITSALGALLTSADVIIISWLRSASDVGIYSAAVRIVQVLYLVPTIFQFSTLPLIAQLANKDNERLRSVFERTLGMIFLTSVPLAIGGIILAKPIMSLVFGPPYVPGAPSFQVLMLTLFFDFPLTVISTAIFAYNRQKNLIVSASIAGGLNVILDLLLIPPFGITGSAFATLIAQAATNWYLWSVMKKINYFEVLSKLGKITAAGIGMGAVTLALYFAHIHAAFNIGISALAYFAFLKLFNEPLMQEVLVTLHLTKATV